MQLRHIDTSPEGKARTAKIKKILPEISLVDSMLMPRVDIMYPLLVKILYAELEIYREYPKKPLDETGKAKVAIKTFDARNHTTCFQGKAFTVKDHTHSDAELSDYRNAVGTFNHAEWGDATLMEIWGGDHMKDHPEMVKEAFKYGTRITNTRPVLKFYINPLFKHYKSGKTKLTDEQKIYQYDQDLLLAKAMTWGARTPEECRKVEDARERRSAKVQAKHDAEYAQRRKSTIGI
jgi:hypothetical protein